jgi:hypothetical protein
MPTQGDPADPLKAEDGPEDGRFVAIFLEVSVNPASSGSGLAAVTAEALQRRAHHQGVIRQLEE